MSASGTQADDLVNKGFIVDRPDPGPPGRAGRTFIVTGLYRSGTSLVASVLRQVGIFMGSEINDIVHEDEAFARVLEARDRDGLKRLIGERNAAYGTWGFKAPMLCRWLDPEDMALFNDPHVIAAFRDPVAISVRTALSEYQEPMRALRNAVGDLAAMMTFLEHLRCPTLLLSYEKSLVFPGDFIDAITQFCGVPQSDALRGQLTRLIEPNRPTYIAGSRRRYEGIIEGVTGGCLYGWCRLTGVADPVALDLFVDDRRVLAFVADAFRQDLLDAGYGRGTNGFYLDLAKLDLRPDAVIRIKVAVHGIELDNSGRRAEEYV
ncbi:MAG TPA: hypothetical protein VND19_11105 [Acetobacteraceae bacterium]|nr:hypothetical protein [Acetobacteraceae bacterium]